MPRERFKIIPAVYLVLMKEGKVLLSRRYHTGFRDGSYSLPAGHLDGGETLAQAMVREAKEEVGVYVKAEDLTLRHVLYRFADDGERVDFYFSCERWSGNPEIMEHNKCDDLCWVDPAALPENTIPYVKQVLEHIENGVWYGEADE